MDTKAKAVIGLTSEDERTLQRCGVGITYKTWRKNANLNLREVSKLLAKDGIKISFSRLALFERGGTNTKGKYVADERRQKVELSPKILSALEKLYGVSAQKSTEAREGWAKLIADMAFESVVGPVLGRYPQSELQKLKTENKMLRSMLKNHERIMETIVNNFPSLRGFIDALRYPLAHGGKNK